VDPCLPPAPQSPHPVSLGLSQLSSSTQQVKLGFKGSKPPQEIRGISLPLGRGQVAGAVYY
jgi:hypothetical protein